MKVKSIITCGLLLLGVGAATTSCEDMFTAENKLVSTDFAPQDTVYQMMGIVKRMQKLADRTVLLGEIRSDLVEIDPTVATTDLQQLYNNNVDNDNRYNQPADYYDVINNCNIYLAYVDANQSAPGPLNYYEKEIYAAKCFRAWCYLELLKIYGEVPFVTEPVLTADDAEAIVASGKKANMATILDFCIEDLEQELAKQPTRNLEMRPGYGVTFWQDVPCGNFFLPVRALLAELYLWRGSYEGAGYAGRDYYIKAIRMYHDYFCFPNEERGVRNYTSGWLDRDHTMSTTSYINRFDVGATTENVAILPCDTVAYYGNVSDIRTVFNSQYSNNYYPWAFPSDRLHKISASQQFCYLYNPQSGGTHEVIYFPLDPSEYTRTIIVGDMRLSSVYRTESNQANSQNNANFNSSRSWVIKWANGSISFPRTDVKGSYIPLYRTTILYLHMAEALNRAGFPETAFAVLKYGLTKKVMDNRSIISQHEFDALSQIKTYGFSLTELDYSDEQNSSFVVWPSNVFYNPDNINPNNNTTGTIAQIGIHSIGSGYTELNERYFLKTDSSQVVPVPAVLPEPAIVEDPGELLEYEAWCEMEGRDPDRSTSKTYYDRYVKQHEADKAAYEEWLITYPDDFAAYKASVKAHDDAVEWNAAWLSSEEVVSKRIEVLSKMILEEEALEGMFEGQRFYDLMRYQMQEGNLSGVNATIQIPQHITDKYGDTREGMIGKPWYLKLPTR